MTDLIAVERKCDGRDGHVAGFAAEGGELGVAGLQDGTCCERRDRQRDCGRLEWNVLDWNAPALAFYRDKLGARLMSDWTTERLDRPQIEALAKG